jgi:hypothetical protein
MAYTYEPPPDTEGSTLVAFAHNNQVAFWGLLFAPILLTAAAEVWEAIAQHFVDNRDFSLTDASTVLSMIDEVVGTKAQRFANALTELRSKSPASADVVFRTITNPDRQIRTLIERLTIFFQIVLEDQSLKTVLVSIENGAPKDFIEYLPSGTKPSGDLLHPDNARKTFFAEVYRINKILAIPDIQGNLNSRKPKVKFWDPNCSRQGSIVGIPVRHPYLEKVTHVITIQSQKVGTFTSSFRARYRRPVQCFIDRLCLEHTLQHLKALAPQQ